MGVWRGKGGITDRWTVPPGVPQVCHGCAKVCHRCASLAHLPRLVSSVKVKSLPKNPSQGCLKLAVPTQFGRDVSQGGRYGQLSRAFVVPPIPSPVQGTEADRKQWEAPC